MGTAAAVIMILDNGMADTLEKCFIWSAADGLLGAQRCFFLYLVSSLSVIN